MHGVGREALMQALSFTNFSVGSTGGNGTGKRNPIILNLTVFVV